MTITIVRAAPYLTVQDFGRRKHREFGVPRGGAMDRFALGAANALVGNDPATAGLEWALGGGLVRFESDCVFALAGAKADASLRGRKIGTLAGAIAHAGDVLEVARFTPGRFLYLAVGGGISVEKLLGSSATYTPAHFGGLDGRLIRTGDVLELGDSDALPRPGLEVPADLQIDYTRRSIRVIPGPQWELFPETDRNRFFWQDYIVSRASDRMGYRLDGVPLQTEMGLLPSEAVCEGAVQIPPGGLPIVLMADSPTVGGYPKIGVVATSDLPVLAQLNPGERFRFEKCTVEDAQRRLRRAAASVFTIASLASKH